jgi:hypothetical protein
VYNKYSCDCTHFLLNFQATHRILVLSTTTNCTIEPWSAKIKPRPCWGPLITYTMIRIFSTNYNTQVVEASRNPCWRNTTGLGPLCPALYCVSYNRFLDVLVSTMWNSLDAKERLREVILQSDPVGNMSLL